MLRAVLLIFVTFAAVGCPPPASNKTKRLDPQAPVGAFALTERSGKTIRETDLQGKVWVASFVFTRCPGPCPQVTATMARLQRELANQPDVRLVTFTVDPSRDDPAELARYADRYQADPERWLFLTGKQAEIEKLLEKQFMVPASHNPAAKNLAEEFDHSTRLALVDRHGLIRGYYEGIRDENAMNSAAAQERELNELKARVLELLSEK